ncbi:isopeptide-forming domain-containing fimbrial protein [Lactobacillus selangorensis]|nr:isopeptide-forming domain-containing fimbrial protein [Lactobacillus selangorensis]
MKTRAKIFQCLMLFTILFQFVGSFMELGSVFAVANEEAVVFENEEYGKATLTYTQPNQTQFDWQLNFEQKASSEKRQVGFILSEYASDKLELPEQVTTAENLEFTKTDLENGETLYLAKEGTNENKTTKITFSTTVKQQLEQYAFKIQGVIVNEDTARNGEKSWTKDDLTTANLLKDEKSQTVNVQNDILIQQNAARESSEKAAASSSSSAASESSEADDDADSDTASTEEKAESSSETEEDATTEAEDTTSLGAQSAARATKISAIAATNAGDLIISDKIFNNAADMKVEVSETKIGATVTRVDPDDENAGNSNYNSYTQIEKDVYFNYLKGSEDTKGSGKVNIKFDSESEDDIAELKKATVEVTYPKVGYIRNSNNKLVEIGAKVKISNIIRSPLTGSDWDGKGYPYKYPMIDLSTNLFSGTVLDGISSSDWNFTFFKVDDGTDVDFSKLSNPYMTFGSLNGHYTENASKPDTPGVYNGEFKGEFVKSMSGVQGSVSGSDSLIVNAKELKVFNSASNLVFENAYTGTASLSEDKDKLGHPVFNTSAVTFGLSGTTNSFQIGTGGGSSNHAWFTFASSAITPTQQTAPAKTVQPLTQYDSDGNASSNESGFDQRFYNDLDRYNAETGEEWALLEQYRVEGHNAENEKELVAGVPKKSDRYVTVGSEYYYFINQPTINYVSEGLVSPDKVTLTDTLPIGVSLSEETIKNSFTLYNLDGSELDLSDDQIDITAATETTGQKIIFTLTEQQIKDINELSKEEKHYGDDFSLRIKVKVAENVSAGEIMENVASSNFSYTTTEKDENGIEEEVIVDFDADSNPVHTVTKEEIKTLQLKLKKIASDTQAGLAEATFTVTKKDDSTVISTATSDTNGLLTFDEPLTVGEYTLKETVAPSGYQKVADIDFTVKENTDGKLVAVVKVGPTETEINENYQIVDHKIPMNLKIKKIDASDNKELSGAEFTLKKGDNTITGTTSWSDLQPGTYTLTETKAPSGYQLSDSVYTITIAKDGMTTVQKDGQPYADVSINKDGNPISITLTIKNNMQPALPVTGGMGILPLLIGGLILMAAGWFGYRKLRQ